MRAGRKTTMRKEKLTIDHHKQLAAHIYAIEQHISDISDILNDKAPAPIQDMFLDANPLAKRLATIKFAMEDLLVKEHHNLGALETSMYFGSVNARCSTKIEPEDDPRAQQLWSLYGRKGN
jgi:hypothetical protein